VAAEIIELRRSIAARLEQPKGADLQDGSTPPGAIGDGDAQR